MDTPFISILCSARGSKFRYHINNVIASIANKEDVEILLKVDSDDDFSSHINFLHNIGLNYKILIYNQMSGYNDLHLFYTDLCKLACGKMLWIFYDDIIILSKNWVPEIKKTYDIYTDHIVVCTFNVKILNKYGSYRDANIYKSLIVSKEWFQCCEYISSTCDIDGHLSRVASKLHRFLKIDSVDIATGISKRSTTESRKHLPPSSKIWDTNIDYYAELIKPKMVIQNSIILPEGMSHVK